MHNPKNLISVTDFGAKGDGVTDDTEAIQAAINHVSKRGGGTVFFPFQIDSIAHPGTLETLVLVPVFER